MDVVSLTPSNNTLKFLQKRRSKKKKAFLQRIKLLFLLGCRLRVPEMHPIIFQRFCFLQTALAILLGILKQMFQQTYWRILKFIDEHIKNKKKILKKFRHSLRFKKSIHYPFLVQKRLFPQYFFLNISLQITANHSIFVFYLYKISRVKHTKKIWKNFKRNLLDSLCWKWIWKNTPNFWRKIWELT